VTLFVYRARDTAYTGFRAPWHPVLPVFFILAAMYVVAGSVGSNPGNALRGALLIALGVPVYLLSRRVRRR